MTIHRDPDQGKGHTVKAVASYIIPVPLSLVTVRHTVRTARYIPTETSRFLSIKTHILKAHTVLLIIM